MKVILRRNIPKLGRGGEVVVVKGGYARNYLLPRGLAYEATPENERRIGKEKKQVQAQATARMAEARELAERLAGLSATVQVKADGETIYGSVGAAEIVAALASEHGLELDESAIRLEEPIRKVGTHDVRFHLAEDAEATVKVWVLPEDGELPPVEPAEGAAEKPAEGAAEKPAGEAESPGGPGGPGDGQ